MPRAAAVRKPAQRLAREDRIADILRAARRVFRDKGYDQATVAEIAARTGVVEGLVFKYFPTKRDLLLKVLEGWYDEMLEDLDDEPDPAAGGRARLRSVIWRHLRAVHDAPLLCRLMFNEVRSERDYHGSQLHARNRRYTRALLEAVELGVRTREFRKDVSPALLRDLVYGGIEHHAWNYICGRGGLDVARITDQIVAVVCEGMAVDGSQAMSAPSPRRKPGSRASPKDAGHRRSPV